MGRGLDDSAQLITPYGVNHLTRSKLYLFFNSYEYNEKRPNQGL